MKPIRTLRDAERERKSRDYSASELRALDEARENEARRACVMADPGIGMLMKNGKLVYYKFHNGRYYMANDPRSLPC